VGDIYEVPGGGTLFMVSIVKAFTSFLKRSRCQVETDNLVTGHKPWSVARLALGFAHG
jgi:hypothetical protein